MHALTADFSVIDPHRMMRTYAPTEGSTQPLLHAWRIRVNINAIRCERRLDVGNEQRYGGADQPEPAPRFGERRGGADAAGRLDELDT
jgi:hypothetical protein